MGVDYNRIAHFYDKYRTGGGPFMPVIVRLAALCDARNALELGPGTGNNTATFLDAHPCRLVGLDLSMGMLQKAHAKGMPAKWVGGSATAVPLADESMDFVFGCFMLHHIPSFDSVFRECARVLRPHGCVAFATSPHDFIRRHPMNRYFPSFAAMDTARFQSEEEIREALHDAGFRGLNSERVASAPYPIDRQYADRVAGRFISTYDLIPSEEFNAGVRRLYADIEARGRLEQDMVWESVVIWGHAPPHSRQTSFR